VTVRTIRSSTAVGFEAALGKFTSIPRYIMGAVSMKISSRTSTTSTSGMILISARLVPIRRGPCDSSALNIAAGSARLRGGAAPEIQEIHREAFHLDGPVLHAGEEEVVPQDGGGGRAPAAPRPHHAPPGGGRGDREA